MRCWIVALALLVPTTSFALNPLDPRFREGANHHLGDDSFIARFGRKPGATDGEELRMKTHLQHVRAWLASRPATRPELAPVRARLLGYLDEYVDKGITPKNAHLPWRNPVFIDDDGNVCAVGYLMERSVGRAVPEKIARLHRYDLLEDIDMPEVKAWVEGSGFTLEELASIQPGYAAPTVETWRPWAEAPEDGPNAHGGSIKKRQMDGAWIKKGEDGTVLGSGSFALGTGSWKSVYEDGARMAEGPYIASKPHGLWRFYHPSGNLAAEGLFQSGIRDGFWQFYADTMERTPLATGTFTRGRVSGVWRHYDERGALLAVSHEHTPRLWEGSFGGHMLHILPGKDGIHRWAHQGNIEGNPHRLDLFFDGAEMIYLQSQLEVTYDAHGNKLEKVDGQWRASACAWSEVQRRAAARGDLVTMHGFLARDVYDTDRKTCRGDRPIAPERGRRIDRILASIKSTRSIAPDFVQKLALGDYELEGDEEEARRTAFQDMTRVLSQNMTWYVEWPHVDGRFIAVFKTLPGYSGGS